MTTPLTVRDEILVCFRQAHCDDLQTEDLDDEIRTQYCNDLVRNIFKEEDADFDNPTKEDLLKVIKSLAEFSKNFRNQETVKKHFGEIMSSINKIK